MCAGESGDSSAPTATATVTGQQVEAEQRASALVDQLCLAEKIQIMHGEPEFFAGMHDLVQNDAYHQRPCTAGVLPQHGIPGIRFIDGPRGVVLEGGATTFPVPMARGATFDPELERKVGQAIGREHRVLGGNLFGGVCINLLRHPAWGRAQETYGEDSHHLGEMGAALTIGVQEHVMACVKHFAANSIENARFQVDVRIEARALHEVYLPHFKKVVDAGVASVMSAYNALNGEWCGQSPQLLRRILKERWGFRGFVLTDFVFGMRDAREALLAGQDLEMPFRMHYARHLERLVRRGKVPEALVDEAVQRILAQQFDFEQRPRPDRSVLACDDHLELARDVARRSFVLLQNNLSGQPLLPLDPSERIAVLGGLAARPNLGDHGSSDGRPESVVTPLDGLRAAVADPQLISFGDGVDIEDAARQAASADVAVVVAGYTFRDEGEYMAPISFAPFAQGIPGPKWLEPLVRMPAMAPVWRAALATGGWWQEQQRQRRRRQRRKRRESNDTPRSFAQGGDRRSLRLPSRQVDLIRRVAAANPRTVVLIMSGSAVLVDEWAGEVGAVMMIWYPGMQGGHAVADVLFGHTSPGGRLPFVVPQSEQHLPTFDPEARQIDYDLWHGYRKLARDGNTPAFPFGFGLSYTEFRLDGLQVASTDFAPDGVIELSAEIHNTGDRAGECVAQLYFSQLDQTVERAPYALCGFHRVALAAGESERIQFAVPVRDLAVFEEELDDFVVPPGDYEFTLANFAGDRSGKSVTVTVRTESPKA